MTGSIRRFALTHYIMARAALPVAFMAGLILATTALARQRVDAVIITEFLPPGICHAETLDIIDPNRLEARVTIELPDGYCLSFTRVLNRRSVIYTRNRTDAEGIQVLVDLFTFRELELPARTRYMLSPDEQLLALKIVPAAAERDAPGTLHTFDLAEWDMRPVTDGLILDIYGWTRDNRLAFVRDDAVFITAPGGHNPRRITPPEVTNLSRIWLAPDGNHLAFTSGTESEPATVSLIHVPSGSVRTLDDIDSVTDARWSPDSRHLLLFTGIDDLLIVYVLDMQTGATRILSTQLANETPRGELQRTELVYHPNTETEWSPDNQRMATLLMLNRIESRLRLILVDLAAGTVTAQGDWNDMPNGWSDDGRYLLVRRVNQDIFPNASYLSDLYIYTFDGTVLHDSVRLPGRASEAAWLPGHNRIVYYVPGPLYPQLQIYLLDVETGDQIHLADNVSQILYIGP